jgi:hypothetical protein
VQYNSPNPATANGGAINGIRWHPRPLQSNRSQPRRPSRPTCFNLDHAAFSCGASGILLRCQWQPYERRRSKLHVGFQKPPDLGREQR